MVRASPRTTLFPYTTLFRSVVRELTLDEPHEERDRAQDQANVLRRHDHRDVRVLRLVEQLACLDRKSTRLNSSHPSISYAVFCLKKKKNNRKCSTTALCCLN